MPTHVNPFRPFDPRRPARHHTGTLSIRLPRTEVSSRLGLTPLSLLSCTPAAVDAAAPWVIFGVLGICVGSLVVMRLLEPFEKRARERLDHERWLISERDRYSREADKWGREAVKARREVEELLRPEPPPDPTTARHGAYAQFIKACEVGRGVRGSVPGRFVACLDSVKDPHCKFRASKETP